MLRHADDTEDKKAIFICMVASLHLAKLKVAKYCFHFQFLGLLPLPALSLQVLWHGSVEWNRPMEENLGVTK